MRGWGASAVALGLMVAAAPAAATDFQFFEGNNCSQDGLFGYESRTQVDLKYDLYDARRGRANDEARSVRVTSNWKHRPDTRRFELKIADHPSGSGSDDYVILVIDDVRKIPADGVCIGSFERNFDRHGIRLERHPRNGLDGKVSYVYGICNAACRADIAVPDKPRPTMIRGKIKPTEIR
mgnify:CR=1 FL=1